MTKSSDFEMENLDVPVNGIVEIYYTDYIRIISDKSNLSHRSTIFVPEGFEILKAEFVVSQQKHGVDRSIDIVQPGTIAVSWDALVSLDSSLDELAGEAKKSGKGVEGFLKLKTAASILKFMTSVISSNRGKVSVRAWADGKKFSSKDGVLISDLRIKIWRRVSASDITALVAEIAMAAIENTDDAVSATIGKIKDAADASAGKNPKPAVKLEGEKAPALARKS